MIGRAMKRIRIEKGLTQEKLARRAGITLRPLSDIERGVSDPRLSTVLGIARALNVPVEELLGDEGEGVA